MDLCGTVPEQSQRHEGLRWRGLCIAIVTAHWGPTLSHHTPRVFRMTDKRACLACR